MNKILIALLSLTATFSVLAAEGFSSFEEQMTGKEFAAAGLTKLSRQELDSLNNWIRKHSLATLDSPKTGAEAVASVDDESDSKSDDEDEGKGEKRTTITSNLVGKFAGWDGQTVFKLQDGTIWAQADKDKFHTKEIENPVVIIEPGMFGAWRLQVEGYDEDCKVKRIQ